MRPPALAVSLVLVTLTGCLGFGQEAPAAETAASDNASASNSSDFALPVGGSSAAKEETNKTVNGTFGSKHLHDYWQGHESMIIYQKDVRPAIFPFFPGGQGSTPQGVLYVIIPNGTLVWEGTEKVSVLAKAPTVNGVAHPSPPAVSFQYRTAADTKWRPSVPLTYGTAVDIKVAPDETDMPHSTQSLWNFRILFDRASLSEAVNFTVTVHRGREVVDWPGHPDFYAEGKTERVIFDKDMTTHQDGFPMDGFYEGTEAWFAPDKLISWQTGILDVYVNVSSFSSTPPIPATLFELYYHNATRLGIGCCDGDLAQDVDGKNDLKSYHFTVNVTTDGMDGPYQPGSRWGFHMAAVTGAFSDSASYDIGYHIKIIARKALDAQVPVT